MKTRQIHGLGLGEFLIFAPAKEMLKSAYFFSALLKSGCFFISADHRQWRTFSTHPHVPGYGRVLSLRDDGHTDVGRFCQCQSNDEGNRRRAVV